MARQVRFTYNGLGQLVTKTTSGVTTQYLIDDLSPTGYPQVVEELVNGQVRREYTYGLERISELQTVNGAPSASFYQYDGRGTVRLLTNSAGAVTDSFEYDAFGNLIASTGTTPNDYLYRGERYDADLGFYYLRPPAGVFTGVSQIFKYQIRCYSQGKTLHSYPCKQPIMNM